jgi:S-adenosylmethionine:diacylglycerol 3-amino-3-carboxypropyl transferase
MSDKQLEKVGFEIVRYSNCWEDADILLKALDLNSKSKVMSIASAGDNCFSMATMNPEKIIAVDISDVQLHLMQLKIEAIKEFDRDDYMRFVGLSPSTKRAEVYDLLKPRLSTDCAAYWDSLPNQIEGGIVHYGKFEQYFQLFRNKHLHGIHSQEIVDQLFESKSADEQCIFHDNIWHNDEWHKMYSFFFGEQMMGEKMRDPEFLKHVEGSVSEMIMGQEMKHLRKKAVQKNYFLYYMLNNKFEGDFVPHYLRPEEYLKVKKNIDCIILHQGLLDSATIEHGDCTHFNLSDIFEYMDMNLFKSVAKQLMDNSAPNAKFAFWNLMVPRNMIDLFPNEIEFNKAFCNQLTEEDMGYFYRAFVLNTKR